MMKSNIKTLFKLRPGTKLNTDFYVFDTETIERRINKKTGKEQIRYTLRGRPENFGFGVVYGKNYTKVIYNLEELKNEFLHPRYEGKPVFAHNAEYDLTVLFGNIYTFDPEAIFNGKFISATNGNCIFADSMNIYPTSVEKLGAMMGKPKLNISYNWQNGIKQQDINYCIRDCEIVYDALLQIFEESGKVKITQAGLAMVNFRMFYQQYNIQYKEEVKFFWNSYYGGRTEAFKIGNTSAVVYDINSSYPYAMIKSVFPDPKRLNHLHFVKVNRFLEHYLPRFEGCAEITVEHVDDQFGFLPLKKDGKLIFPTGKFTGTYNFPEIRFALKHKAIRILKVKHIVYAEAIESPFKEYINSHYKKRLAATDDLTKTIEKLYMNCLYGKFSQKIDKEHIYLHDLEKQIHIYDRLIAEGKKVKIIPFNEIRKDCFLEIKKDEKDIKTAYSIPLFSSYITSFGRIKLLSLMLKYRKNKPVYCDTDSVFFEIDPHIKDSYKLGDWKKENKIVTAIYGLKNYSYISEEKLLRKLKGVPKKAKEISPNIFEYQTLIKTKEGLRRKKESGTKQRRIKVISNRYDKRIVFENGETKPIKL